MIRGARENNLKNLDVAVPLGKFVVVTGVSGSGKSSLITEILVKRAVNVLQKGRQHPGRHDAIEGFEHLDKIVDIDQSAHRPHGLAPTPPPTQASSLSSASSSLPSPSPALEATSPDASAST